MGWESSKKGLDGIAKALFALLRVAIAASRTW